MTIRQGALYWVQRDDSVELVSHIPHPQVVIEQVADHRVVVCGLTTNARKFYLPGNVLLEVGEANLQRRSAVYEVAKRMTIAQAQLGEYIGIRLSGERVRQILAGVRLVGTLIFSGLIAETELGLGVFIPL